jgi:small subunit ribosomal protein S3
MGQKVHPFGFRLGPLYTWKSRWFGSNPAQYKKQMLEDNTLRNYLYERLKQAGLTEVIIERSINTITIILHVSRPGVVIGRGGANLEQLKKDILTTLNLKTDSKSTKVELKVEEEKNPDIQAKLIINRLIDQLEHRYPHRRAVNQALEKAIAAGAKGIKIILSGRINGAEIGRTEKYTQGTVPTQTLRADIDYSERPALTKSGFVGIKVYVYKGERQTN